MKEVWIAAAQRTVQGKFLGALSPRSAVELGIAAAAAALEDAPLAPEHVDSVIVGNVLGAGLGMNIARQIGIGLGLPQSTPAFTVNMMCASGLQSVILGAQAIREGSARVVLCGGTESMSNAPHLLPRARTGFKLGDATLVDSLLRDGLTDAFSHEHMGMTAERLAEQYGISRQEQDAYAAQSQQRYAAALAEGLLATELVPLEGLAADEFARPDSTVEKLAGLRPVFKQGGSVTAGNASGINDGAAMLLLCDAETGRAHGLRPLMHLTGAAAVGCDPALMGLGPVFATRKLGWSVADYDHVELNEAYAVQVLACMRELGLDPARTNPHGGAIALGHPIGASGARLLVHLCHSAPQRGLATLCAGGGMGVAVRLERP